MAVSRVEMTVVSMAAPTAEMSVVAMAGRWDLQTAAQTVEPTAARTADQ
jgi:hypothetical protein